MKIGKFELPDNIVLAPVAGYSDVGFRALAKKYGAGLTYTEMVSAKGLVLGGKNNGVELLATTESESLKAVQLFGHEPEYIKKAIRLPLLEKFDIIDINMGCPVGKITSNGEGSYLMKTPLTASAVVSSAVEAAEGRPVTVKMRLGYDNGDFTAVDFARYMEDAGAAAITVHGRYKAQMYSGESDDGKIAEVKNAVTIPVFANGDITSRERLSECEKTTRCDGYMIARAALGKPWIFAEFRDKHPKIDVKADILSHIEILKGIYPLRVVANNMKKHLCFYAKNTPSAKAVRVAVATAKTLDDIYALVDECFSF